MFILLNFLLMWVFPFVFFTRFGRGAMGLSKVTRPIWLEWGPLLGMAAALAVFVAGWALYGRGADNWYVSVLNSYTC